MALVMTPKWKSSAFEIIEFALLQTIEISQKPMGTYVRDSELCSGITK